MTETLHFERQLALVPAPLDKSSGREQTVVLPQVVKTNLEAGRLRLHLQPLSLSSSLSSSSSPLPSAWLNYGHLSLLLHIKMAERTFPTM